MAAWPWTHVVQIQNDTTGTWFEAFVDAHSGDLVTVTDFVARASVLSLDLHSLESILLTYRQYRVLPIQKETLPEGFQVLTDPQDVTASPQGWHSDGTTSTTTTA